MVLTFHFLIVFSLPNRLLFRHPENVSNHRAPRIVDRCDILHVTTIPKTSSERKNFQSPILGNVNGHPWVYIPVLHGMQYLKS